MNKASEHCDGVSSTAPIVTPSSAAASELQMYWEARDKHHSALHEAAHCVVAEHFDFGWSARIWRVGPITKENKSWVGRTVHTGFLDEPFHFRSACVCWAGALVDELVEDPSDWMGAAIATFENHHYEGMTNVSPTDLDGINGHPMRWRTCKTAAHILYKRYDRLMQLAALLEQNGVITGSPTLGTAWR